MRLFYAFMGAGVEARQRPTYTHFGHHFYFLPPRRPRQFLRLYLYGFTRGFSGLPPGLFRCAPVRRMMIVRALSLVYRVYILVKRDCHGIVDSAWQIRRARPAI